MNTVSVQALSCYYCAKCGRPAVVTALGVQRSCSCNAVVIAECSSNLKGEGKLKS